MPLIEFTPTPENEPNWKFHPDDTMSAYRRVQETINLKIADRFPINANMSLHAYHLMGLDTKEGVWGIEDPHTALKEVFNRYGGWDHLEFVGGVGAPNVYPTAGGAHYQRVKTAGIDLPADAPALVEHIEEPPLMEASGYDEILNNGFFRFLSFRKLGYSGLLSAADPIFWENHISKLIPIVNYWKNRKVSFVASHLNQPFEILSFMRNTKNFLTDLIRYQDKIKAVLDMSIDGFIEGAKRFILYPKLDLLPEYNFVEILCLVGGGGTSKGARRMYSPRVFETLYFPYLKKMVHELHKVGYRIVLHLDASWTEVLHYFKEIPKGQIAWLETDGSTDLVKAKEILGGHHCIGGDVPATILTSGSVKNVEDYVQHLIDEVAPGGGFILTSGCEIPPDAKFENVRAMIQYAKDHGRYRD